LEETVQCITLISSVKEETKQGIRRSMQLLFHLIFNPEDAAIKFSPSYTASPDLHCNLKSTETSTKDGEFPYSTTLLE
jgi:hypothetical protein